MSAPGLLVVSTRPRRAAGGGGHLIAAGGRSAFGCAAVVQVGVLGYYRLLT
jgi:hypothetical protein